ncbi:DNA internalization-related competence protein ComEC/Rec2 [Psychromonas sp. B3M02]|uniref:DNA internalization-related competence protein ComEC/Rec2 n=1 Tax=Psychromonas sp. B3M02 TaxID=2267226 RepID=UPI000DE8F967|nr:DNA internalization-related competence protein ComEC/Rec2 [Psychromonas sp. B3M02]RBW47866.1 DNA internalization-related competence protein ComEC/Rec2 [Psychromonas sp. B3M02]
MRITISLSIVTFITTLYWPQLLNESGLLSCAYIIVILMCWPRCRYLTIVPITALYFSFYVYTTLFGINHSITTHNNTQVDNLLNNNHQSLMSFISENSKAQDNTITVQVKSLINTKNSGYFVARMTAINEQACIICPLIEMRWFRPTLIVQAGQVHQFNVRIKALQGKANPDGFDRQKWRYAQHIAYIASIKQHVMTIDSAISWRAKIYNHVLKLTEGLPHQGAIITLIFADKSLISVQDKNTIASLGIAHLFAISGLHIGLLFVFSFILLYNLCKWVMPIHHLGWTSWRLANVFGLIVCIGYGYISGFSLPTQRALLMLLLSIIMLSSKRKIALFDLLFICFWGMLLFDPLAILSNSLWLSYTAMCGIVIFLWLMKGRQVPINQQLSWWQVLIAKSWLVVKNLLSLQLMLTLFMLPIQLINFSAVSSFALMINLIAIPLFSWVIIPVVLSGALFVLISDSISYSLLSLADHLLVIFFDYAEPFTNGYMALSDFSVSSLLSLLLFALLYLFSCLYSRFFVVSNKARYGFMGIFLLFCCVTWLEKAYQKQASWQVEVFDVGQGLAILISSDGQHLLYDTGPSYGEHYAVANSTLIPYLKAKGVETLDVLMVSHSDNDHAGGAKVIQNAFSVTQAFSGEASVLNASSVMADITQYQQCLAGQVIYLGQLTMTLLAPITLGKNNNDNSCVLKVSDGQHSVLLTGDISKKIEQKLITTQNAFYQEQKSSKLASDILIAPHHGSKTSSSEAFIKQVKPTWVVFSAGYKNRWRFPIQSVVERYQELGVEHLTTAKTGFIRFNVQNQRIEVKTYREDLASYWYHQHLAF